MKHGITAFAIGTNIPINMKNAIFLNQKWTVPAGQARWFPITGTLPSFTYGSTSDSTDPANSSLSVATVIPCPGTIKNLFVYLDSDVAGGAGMTYTLYKNGVAQALTLTGGAGSTGNPILLSDTTHSFFANAGDVVALFISAGAGITTPSNATVAMEFDPA